MLPQRVSIECELHEHVHLGRLLADNKLSVVGRGELIQSEEAQVGEDLVEGRIVAIRATQIPLEENFGEDLK